MRYTHDNNRLGNKRLWPEMFIFFAVTFAGVNFSSANGWSCTHPANEIIRKAIEEYPGQNYSISNNNEIFRHVEDALQKREGFQTNIVSCNGPSCRFSKEFIDFIGGKISIPSQEIEMSICSTHQPNCWQKYCSKNFPDRYDVIYRWDGGSVGFGLEVSKTLSDQMNVDEFIEDNSQFDPRIKDSYYRSVGVSANSRLTISITTLN